MLPLLPRASRVNDMDPQKIVNMTKKATKKLSNSKKTDKYLSDLKLTGQMLRDYFAKEYTLLSPSTAFVAVFALIYIISPVDIIPDWLPFVGALDDIAVLFYLLHTVKEELKYYKLWLATKDMRADKATELIGRVEKYTEKKKNADVQR